MWEQLAHELGRLNGGYSYLDQRRERDELTATIAERDQTVEIQQFDGTIDEVDADRWQDLMLMEVSAPEDWSGSVDMDPEDFVSQKDNEIPSGFHDPLAFLDKI